MHVDAMLGPELRAAAAGARALEEQGFEAAWCGGDPARSVPAACAGREHHATDAPRHRGRDRAHTHDAGLRSGPNPFGNPKIFVAGVGELMTAVAGEVSDGLLLYSFVTERYVREVTLGALQHGIGRSGRERSALSISYPAFVVIGATDQELEDAAQQVRAQIAFYGSTPSYRPVLDLHGWGDLHEELRLLSKAGCVERDGTPRRRRRAAGVRSRRATARRGAPPDRARVRPRRPHHAVHAVRRPSRVRTRDGGRAARPERRPAAYARERSTVRSHP
jgi:hypothetical protein